RWSFWKDGSLTKCHRILLTSRLLRGSSGGSVKYWPKKIGLFAGKLLLPWRTASPNQTSWLPVARIVDTRSTIPDRVISLWSLKLVIPSCSKTAGKKALFMLPPEFLHFGC